MPTIPAAAAGRACRELVASIKRACQWALAALVLGGVVACRSPQGGGGSDGNDTVSLYEQRLLRAIDDKAALEAAAQAAAEADFPEIERRFHQLAAEFNSILADNPEQIEARLIYAKLLDYFGDRTGARDQFAEVLKRDPTVAVAYQQLGTWFAEEGEHAQALAYYLLAIEHAPGEAIYHYGVGDLLFTFRPGFLEDGAFEAATLDSMMQEAFRKAAALAPGNLAYQFRYGESFYDVPASDWAEALATWEALDARTDLSPLQHEAISLHRARCLGELGRYAEARALAARVTSSGLAASRRALLAALAEAEGE